jgi:hypothetical protein
MLLVRNSRQPICLHAVEENGIRSWSRIAFGPGSRYSCAGRTALSRGRGREGVRATWPGPEGGLALTVRARVISRTVCLV